MVQAARSLFSPSNPEALIHSSRTAVAAVVSWYVARLFKLPEEYWATISTMIVMQSELGAALIVSEQRFLGTAVGAAVGGLLGLRYQNNVPVFGAAVFAMGLFCALFRLHRSAYRFAAITLAIILLVSNDRPAWMVASHRFFEVSVGIVVGLALTAIWPEKPATAAGA
jgi:uncharacterized membrane protein YccC